MLTQIWDFIKDNWMWILIGLVVVLFAIRMSINNPKYHAKEILKNPLLLFLLFAKAAEETVELAKDAAEVVVDISSMVNSASKQTIATKDEIKNIKDVIENTIDEIKK